MLLLALGAVVVGFAFLVVSLLSQEAGWAWGCIAACVVGAGLVVADAVRRRRPSRAREGPGAGAVLDGPGLVEASVGLSMSDTGRAGEQPEHAGEQPEPVGSLRPAGLTQSVLVVDEHPEFHVADCAWLDGRTTITLPVGEAVDLGFTPCARCTPEARFTGGPPGPGSR